MSLVPDGYSGLVDLIGVEVRTTRLRAARAANTELVAMNWRIGRLILERQQAEPWGSGVIKRLALDLRRQFPGMTGLSATNLQYMRAFAAAWPDQDAVSQRSVGKLPWGHVCTLLASGHPLLHCFCAVRGPVNYSSPRGRSNGVLSYITIRPRRSLSRHGGR